jgi:Protein of unknown function (DUF1344)
MNGGEHMKVKGAVTILLIAFAVLFFAGTALAKEMSGKVIAVDPMKGTLTLKSGTVETGFDCEEGSMIKDVKVGDMVIVHYKVKDGKKMATKITEKKKKAGGGM